MATTVNEMILRLRRRADPNTKDLETWTAENAGVDEGRFTAQRILDIYNQARVTLTSALLQKFPNAKAAISRLIPGNVTTKDDLAFQNGIAQLPSGYVFAIDLADAEGNQIYVLGIDRERVVKDAETDTNRFVFEIGGFLKAPTGSDKITDGNYQLRYYKIEPFTLSDVNGGVVTETYDEQWLPLLEEIAVLLSNEAGNLETSSIVEKFFLQQQGAR
jgi:hypothetical protein